MGFIQGYCGYVFVFCFKHNGSYRQRDLCLRQLRDVALSQVLPHKIAAVWFPHFTTPIIYLQVYLPHFVPFCPIFNFY